MSIVIHIDQFDGPLDLLLQLIRRARVQIEDILISGIIEQYLELMPNVNWDEVEMDRASEFLSMAALLLEIKSNRLLPRPPVEEEAAEEETPEQLLVRRLEEYARMKEASSYMGQLEEDFFLTTYYKLPEEYYAEPQPVEFEGLTVEMLCKAFAQVTMRLKEQKEKVEPVREIRKEPFTVEERTHYIMQRLAGRGRVTFTSLFDESATRMELVVTFLALLELIRARRVMAQQEGSFAQIYLMKHQGGHDG